MKLGKLFAAVFLVGVAACSASAPDEEVETTEQENTRLDQKSKETRYCVAGPTTQVIKWMVDGNCDCSRFAPGSEPRDMCDYESLLLQKCLGYPSCPPHKLPKLLKVKKNDNRLWVNLDLESLPLSCDELERAAECIAKLNVHQNAWSGRFNNQPAVSAHFAKWCKTEQQPRCKLPVPKDDVFDPCPGGCLHDKYQ
jgi:hypothetical protein